MYIGGLDDSVWQCWNLGSVQYEFRFLVVKITYLPLIVVLHFHTIAILILISPSIHALFDLYTMF